MPRYRAPRSLTPTQHFALSSAGPDGVLAATDRRYLNNVHGHGWTTRSEVRRSPRSRKTKTIHVITQAGRDALASLPVVEPRERPNWRGWDRQRLAEGRYLVRGHELYRPARGMLWRLICPTRPADQPVHHAETLAEAVEALSDHLHGADACRHTTPTGPRAHHPADRSGVITPHTDPDVIDLDALDLTAPAPSVRAPHPHEPTPGPADTGPDTEERTMPTPTPHPPADVDQDAAQPADDATPAVPENWPAPYREPGAGEATQFDLFGIEHPAVTHPQVVKVWRTR